MAMPTFLHLTCVSTVIICTVVIGLRSHFGAWAIVSSPLILSHDVNNDTLTAEIWPLIANREALAINQAYFGNDSGGPFLASEEMLDLGEIEGWQAFPGVPNAPSKHMVSAPAFQYLAKPLSGTKVAVLLMNSARKSATLVLNFDQVPGITCPDGCRVRDVWQHQNLGIFHEKWSVSVGSHDAAFVILERPAAAQANNDRHPVKAVVSTHSWVTLFMIAVTFGIAVMTLFRRNAAASKSWRGSYERIRNTDGEGVELEVCRKKVSRQRH